MEKPPYDFSTLTIGIFFMAALGGSLIGKLGKVQHTQRLHCFSAERRHPLSLFSLQAVVL